MEILEWQEEPPPRRQSLGMSKAWKWQVMEQNQESTDWAECFPLTIIQFLLTILLKLNYLNSLPIKCMIRSCYNLIKESKYYSSLILTIYYYSNSVNCLKYN